jgi:hypothetical protein
MANLLVHRGNIPVNTLLDIRGVKRVECPNTEMVSLNSAGV